LSKNVYSFGFNFSELTEVFSVFNKLYINCFVIIKINYIIFVYIIDEINICIRRSDKFGKVTYLLLYLKALKYNYINKGVARNFFIIF